MTTADLQARWQRVMLNNYGTPAMSIVSGSGTRVTDADGRTYLDALAGIAVSTLGHAHPEIVAAIAAQAATLMHSSNLAVQPVALELAERLVAISGWEAKVFFSQDGATANEAALKIARRRGYALVPDGGKQRIVAAAGGFHGRTMGALAVTGNPAKRDPFAPFGHEVTFVPYGDAHALAAALGPDVAAVILEPAQGENGVVVPPANYLHEARALTLQHGALLIVDEVQSGIGRTGAWFASHTAGIIPDIVTLAKGLAGGMPIGAVLVTGDAREALLPGDHGTTFGGNPVSCAAALTVLDVIHRDGLLVHVRDTGEYLRDAVHALEAPVVARTQGMGLWFGLTLTADVAPVVERRMRELGVIVNAAKPNVIRIAPPLIITRDEIDELVAALAIALAEVAA